MTPEDLRRDCKTNLPKLHAALLKYDQDVQQFERLTFLRTASARPTNRATPFPSPLRESAGIAETWPKLPTGSSRNVLKLQYIATRRERCAANLASAPRPPATGRLLSASQNPNH